MNQQITFQDYEIRSDDFLICILMKKCFAVVDPFFLSHRSSPQTHTHTANMNENNNVLLFEIGKNWNNWFHNTWHWLNFNSLEPTINLADWRVIIWIFVYKQKDKLIEWAYLRVAPLNGHLG